MLDLGCGPGLIAERLAVAGAAVTGIDVSTSSLTHARESAARRGLTIDYRRQDFREVADDAGFDLVLQSYGEFGTLDAATLATVLARIRRALRPGGALVFDVTTPAAPVPPTREPVGAHPGRTLAPGCVRAPDRSPGLPGEPGL